MPTISGRSRWLSALIVAVELVALAPPAAAAPGDLDATFSGDGIQTTDIGVDEVAQGVAIQANDRVVVVGYQAMPSDVGAFALVRYRTNGNLDSTFSGDGKKVTQWGTGSDTALAVAIQDDRKIVVVGYSPGPSDEDFAIARYTSHGRLDTSFSGDGKRLTDFGQGADEANGVAIQGDGRIVVVGFAGTGVDADFAIARYRPNGRLDRSFSGDGKRVTDFAGFSEQAKSVALQDDGRIVVVGYASNGADTDFAIARYTTHGRLDTRFGGDGLVTTAVSTAEDVVAGVAIQPDGRIVAAGSTYNGTDTDVAVARYRSRGGLDNNFDNDGMQATDFGFGSDQAGGVAIADDGAIVVGGSATTANENFGLVRYLSDGTPDPSFSGDGMAFTAIGSSTDSGIGVVLQSDGRIVLAGYTDNGTDSDFAVTRWEA